MMKTATLTVYVQHHEFFDAWCPRCLVTALHVRLYLRMGNDGVVKRICTRCEGLE